MSEITITVSGRVGCGKSAMLGEIEILCKALGLPVRFQDEAKWQVEKNGTHADWIAALEMYQPSIVLVEANPANVAQSVSDAALAALKKLQRCMAIGTGCMEASDDQVVMQFADGFTGLNYTELTFGDLRNLATLPCYSSTNVAQVGELSADVILGYAREVGILGPVSDGNALKYARLVIAAAKK